MLVICEVFISSKFAPETRSAVREGLMGATSREEISTVGWYERATR